MLIFRNIIIVILLLVLCAISVVGIMVEAPRVLEYTPDRINALGRSVLTVMRPGNLLFYTWIAVFLATLLVFFLTIARPRRRMKIEVQMGGGRVVIMDAAIKKYIRNALAEINEVTVKKIELREQRGLVTTDIYADVRTRENLPVLELRIIGRVRSALAEDLGITNLGDVHVYIRNFEVTGRPITPAPAPAKQPERLEDTETHEEAIGDETRPAPITGTEATTGPSSATPAAAVASGAGGAIAAGALAEPIEPPGSADPIVLEDKEDDSLPGPAGDEDSALRRNMSPPLAVEPAEEKLSIPDEEAGSTSKDDLDEPLPWGVYQSPPESLQEPAGDEDKDKPTL